MTTLSIPRRGATLEELFTIELAPGVTQVVTEDEKFASKREGKTFIDITNHPDLASSATGESPLRAAVTYPSSMTQTTAARSLVSKLSAVNMRSELTTFSGFYNRYYPSSYGKQASGWLLGEFQSVVSASGATRPSVKAFTRSWAQSNIVATIPERSSSEVVVGAHLDSVNGRNRSGRSPGAARSSRPLLQQDMMGYGNNPSVITDHVDSGLTAFARKAIDAYTTTGYINTQCGYGCSDHASATVGYPSAFVIEAPMSRTSPYIRTDRDAVPTLSFSHMLEHTKPAISYAYELTFASMTTPPHQTSPHQTSLTTAVNKQNGQVIADNSGARNLYIISVKGIGARLNRLPAGGVGDMVMATVKKRTDGVFLYFEDNAGVIVNPKGEMKGSAITGPVGKEAAELWPRIASNAGVVM
ncbi:hypothetical protein DL769_009294 [Monosporascus sp. CRB-8-3]|nr:hypothetical protein DL769_009294 [Monosporascus sp. CRB-8-3]